MHSVAQSGACHNTTVVQTDVLMNIKVLTLQLDKTAFRKDHHIEGIAKGKDRKDKIYLQLLSSCYQGTWDL